MIVVRTSTPWTAAAVLFCKVFKVDPYKVSVRVERCSRTLKIGLVFKTTFQDDCVSIRRYIISSAVSYLDAISQILATDYGYYK